MRDNKFTFSSFLEITKLRLSVRVVFSSVISYLIGMSEFNFEIFSYLVLGGLMMVSASNIFNQVIIFFINRYYCYGKIYFIITRILSITTSD